MTSPICLVFSLYSSLDRSAIVGSTDIALARFGGQCIVILRYASRIEERVVRELGPARCRESFNAPLEARINDMVAGEMLPWQLKN